MKLKGHYLNSNRERFILGQSFDNPFVMSYVEESNHEEFLLNGTVQYTLNNEDITLNFNNLQIIETADSLEVSGSLSASIGEDNFSMNFANESYSGTIDNKRLSGSFSTDNLR